MHTERRHHCRVVPEHARLRVNLQAPSEAQIPAELIDIGVGGASVRVYIQDVPSLPIGEPVRISVVSSEHDRPFTLAASIRNWIQEKGSRRYGIRFDTVQQ